MLRAPFPYFGSKRHAAHLIWQALGDVASYCEPFCGSAAVLLARPGGAGRIETINDLSGHVSNFWRSVRQAPDEVARHIDYPVIETDLHARHRWLVARHPEMKANLDADPDWCDPKAAGWWAWGASAWTGDGGCSGSPHRKLPHAGYKGVHAVGFSDETIAALARRLRRVNVTSGSWERVVTPAALCEPAANGRIGVFADPPYGADEHNMSYAADGEADVAERFATWAAEAAHEHPSWRIILAGYEGEHEAVLAGWRCVAWDPNKAGFKSGGYGRKNGNPQRERLWLSPACLPVETEAGHQPTLFAEVG